MVEGVSIKGDSTKAGWAAETVEELAAVPILADELLRRAATELQKLNIDSIRLTALCSHIDGLAAVQAACERIASTPLPFTYTLLIHRTTYLYVLLAPWAMVGEMGWMTPVFCGILAYAFFGLDELACMLENPFSSSEMGLPLAAMCRNIEISGQAAMGGKVPSTLRPEPNGLLR